MAILNISTSWSSMGLNHGKGKGLEVSHLGLQWQFDEEYRKLFLKSPYYSYYETSCTPRPAPHLARVNPSSHWTNVWVSALLLYLLSRKRLFCPLITRISWKKHMALFYYLNTHCQRFLDKEKDAWTLQVVADACSECLAPLLKPKS